MTSFYTANPISFFSREQINAVKGFLILSVVIGHLRSLAGINHEVFQFVYNYHVVCFLLLPFLYPIKALNKDQIMIWTARFYVPFTVFFMLYMGLNIVFLNAEFQLGALLKGFFIASPEMIDQATGSAILWFLPHIFLVMIAVSFFFNTLKIPVFILVILSLLAHGIAGFIPREIAFYIPLTASNLFFLFFLGLAIRWLVLKLKDKGVKWAWIFLIFFLSCQFISLMTQNVLGYTGLWIPDFSDPLKLLIINFVIISAMLSLLYFRALERIKILQWLGQHSLIIFVIHQPFLFILWKAIENLNGKAENWETLLTYCIIVFIGALFLSVLCILCLNKIETLKKIVFPRSFVDWQR